MELITYLKEEKDIKRKGGLKEFAQIRGYLIDSCLSAQDVYKEWVKYFYGELLIKE
jgi:hypothetical protein